MQILKYYYKEVQKMFKFDKKMWKKFSSFAALNSLALFLAINSVNLTCMFNHHQPKVPEALDQFRKF